MADTDTVNPALSASNHNLEEKQDVFFARRELVIADYQHLSKTALFFRTRKTQTLRYHLGNHCRNCFNIPLSLEMEQTVDCFPSRLNLSEPLG